MGVATKLQHRIRLLTNLSILVWFNILDTLSRLVRRSLMWLLCNIALSLTKDAGLLAQNYELVRERLRGSQQEIEKKTKQLRGNPETNLRGEGHSRLVAVQGEAVVAADVSKEPPVRHRSELTVERLKALISLPLRSKEIASSGRLPADEEIAGFV
ncbi:hypothetical protein ACFLWZ_06855 [Chloroflexota bacterium]